MTVVILCFLAVPLCGQDVGTVGPGTYAVSMCRAKFAGEASQNWLIMKNGEHAIGLFQGMFENNILTFNPGWDSNAGMLDSFTDVRDLQRQLKAEGVQLMTEADEATTGPASFMAVDPDGNPILVDQHV